MVENGQAVSVGSDVLFGGSGFECGRDIGVDSYCGTLSAISIFLADAALNRGLMQNAREGGEDSSAGIR